MSSETGFPELPADYGTSPAGAEESVLARWREEGTFHAVLDARKDAPAFVFWEGPPTANGRPGIHHALSRTLKDAVCRYHTMLGRRVERKAGWDTHGLPVELEVEKALGISGKAGIEEYGIGAFNEKCRESVWKYREEWLLLSERIGYWLDYDDPYVTYEPDYVESAWWLLARMHQEGLVYRGKRVLPYCGRCGTGLSSHELGQPGAYKEVSDPGVTVRFVLKETLLDREFVSREIKQESLLAWTTTPWTLPANFALAVHKDRKYRCIAIPVDPTDHSGPVEAVWVADERYLDTLRLIGVTGDLIESGVVPIAEQAGAVKSGKELLGAEYFPLYENDSRFDPGAWEPDESGMHKVVTGDFVTVDDGTGIVHQAPYGQDDWETASRYSLPIPQGVGADGRFVATVGPVQAGTWFKEADKAIIDDLKQRGLLFARTQEPHNYPHCWRCDTPLYYYPTDAWYIRTTRLKEEMLEYNRRIRWVPEDVGTKRFGDWLENNVDWNVSRDRYWGTPLPFWVCETCDGEIAISSVAELREKSVAPLPEGFDNHKPLIDEVILRCECGGDARRTPQVADCWFDSGSMPYAQYHWPEGREKVRDQFPADFICEGVDQTRGWFYTLHAIGTFVSRLEDSGLEPGPAFRACLVNGLVLDRDGVKMSKRLGNIVDPWKLIDQHGADAVRWYMITSGAAWLPKRFDERGVGEARSRFFGKLVNSYGFFREYARIDGFTAEAKGVPGPSDRPEIDRWLLSRTQSVIALVRERMGDFDLTGAARALDAFVVDDLSNWYIRRNRRRFWKSEIGPDKLAAHATLHEALATVARLCAPMAPFFAELLYERLVPGSGTVHAALFPEACHERIERDLEDSMRLVQKVVVMGRALRERAGRRTRQPLRAIHLRAGDRKVLELLGTGFATRLILEELNIKTVGSLAADDGKLCSLSAKPNFRTLGKRLGKRMKAAATAIGELSAADLQELRAGEAISLSVEGEEVELTPEDVLVTVESRADFDVETDGTVICWLDVDLDEDLLLEGVAREVVNRVNGLRRDQGLAVEERIRLAFFPHGSEALSESLARHREFVLSETLGVGMEILDGPPDGEHVLEADLGEGRSLSIALSRL